MAQHTFDVTVVVVEQPDFAVEPTPAQRQVVRGSVANFQIITTPLFAFSGDITFTAINVPSGLNVTFLPATIHVDGVQVVSDMQISTLDDVSVIGTHLVTIQASSN